MKFVLILAILTSCIGCDQATKLVAKRQLVPGEILSYAGDTFRLQYAENSGAFLSLGASLPHHWRQWLFTILTGVFLVGLLIYLLVSKSLTRLSLICLSLVCAGGIGNLIDRIAYDGRVVDFLNVGIGPLRTGIFNVADMAITFGALALLLESLRKPKETAPPGD
ncbi:MAG: signal peptidase II [Deltaproteobacteria bacterium]|nr:signal peptidase II [Deltaproteobacteria bacterium]MBM4296562.1 signal peptidase II [Deltaproteobacteria bacterium]